MGNYSPVGITCSANGLHGHRLIFGAVSQARAGTRGGSSQGKPGSLSYRCQHQFLPQENSPPCSVPPFQSAETPPCFFSFFFFFFLA